MAPSDCVNGKDAFEHYINVYSWIPCKSHSVTGCVWFKQQKQNQWNKWTILSISIECAKNCVFVIVASMPTTMTAAAHLIYVLAVFIEPIGLGNIPRTWFIDSKLVYLLPVSVFCDEECPKHLPFAVCLEIRAINHYYSIRFVLPTDSVVILRLDIKSPPKTCHCASIPPTHTSYCNGLLGELVQVCLTHSIWVQ